MYVSPLEQKLRGIIEPSLTAMGYEVVLVRMMESGKSKTLQIIAERVDNAAMSVSDCEAISHASSALLDVADPIHSAYQLEVSSPGLERPLVALKDFARFTGSEAKVEMQLPVDGRKRFRGTIEGVKGEEVQFRTEEGTMLLPFNGMRSAKLVLTDQLMKAYLKKEVTG